MSKVEKIIYVAILFNMAILTGETMYESIGKSIVCSSFFGVVTGILIIAAYGIIANKSRI